MNLFEMDFNGRNEEMAKGSEETTKGLVLKKLTEIAGYPDALNKELNGITIYKEDSYKNTVNSWLVETFKQASKKQTCRSKGTPDFMVVKKDSETIVLIETKGSVGEHSRFENVADYIDNGFGDATETVKYGVDGALWYATFLNDKYDVVAIAVSGQNEEQSRVTSVVLPKGKQLNDIEILEDLTLKDGLAHVNSYTETLNRKLGRNKTDEEVRISLRRYTLDCANFLRANNIEDNKKAGFISALILALTNKDSKLFKKVKQDVEYAKQKATQKIQKKDIEEIEDNIYDDCVDLIKKALYGDGDPHRQSYVKGVFDIDEIPNGKRKSLIKYYDGLLAMDGLNNSPKVSNREAFRNGGKTVLSCCVYSVYWNITELLANRTSIDVMAEFYTTFLRFTKGNAKEKGIVLTPQHITELFCDIAEQFGERKLSEKDRIIDICCGTGSFLIAALNRIKKNIYSEQITDDKKGKRFKKAQQNSLIGVEINSSMYSLAYANMRFHGDGKSNLYNCSSLLYDSFAAIDERGNTFNNEGNEVKLNKMIEAYGDIDYGFINPPYSLDSDKEIKNYPAGTSAEILINQDQQELDFVASMLHYLKRGGIGIAIVPMSCAGNADKQMRAKILEHHTLLACMTMPGNLFFDSHVGVASCIMVFKAHIPHDLNKSVFFARWQDDGFKVIPHNGRKETAAWQNVRQEWMNQLDGSATPNEFVWLRRKLATLKDEALAEAYIKTDYSKLADKDFEKTLKKYALFKYMDENGLLEE